MCQTARAKPRPQDASQRPGDADSFEILVPLVVCFSASLPPNSSGCSLRLTSVGRFARAFVRQRRDHSGRALAFSKTSSED